MATLEDIAREVGVSASTVSRAMSRPDSVAAVTRARILKVAGRLGYQPNLLARNLRQGSSKTIGLILSEIQNSFNATVAKGVQDVAYQHGYSLILCNTDEDEAKEALSLEVLLAQQVEGLIVIPTHHTQRHLERVRRVPLVEVDRLSGQRGVQAVLADNVGGAQAAIRHLLDLGHTRIGALISRPGVTTATERLSGYQRALETAGIALRPQWVHMGNTLTEPGQVQGQQAALELLKLAHTGELTALFCSNNNMTYRALEGVQELGLRLPHDLSLVGFDDEPGFRFTAPPLTVVEQPGYALGQAAAEHLFNQLERQQPAPGGVTRFETRLIVRGSSGPVPGPG